MKDPQNAATAEPPGTNAEPKVAGQSAPTPAAATAPKPAAATTTLSFEELADRKPIKPPASKPAKSKSVKSKPAASKPAASKSVKSKSAASKPAASKPSISIDNDKGSNVVALIVDAVAAAVAMAFTVLLLQDALPFLQ